nr:5905_t:CDS:10 [Entrophospora candida]
MSSHEFSSPDLYASRLMDPKINFKTKLTIATNLRDSVEMYQNSDYPRFLHYLMPVLNNILQNEPPVFDSNSEEQKLRNLYLEILHRLPQNESLRPFAPDLLKLVMNLLKKENEDNAVICLKIIIELHRCHKNLLEDQVQPFLDIVKEMYANMEKAVRDAFDTPGTAVATPSASTPVQSSMPIPPSPRPSSPVSDVTTNESTPNKVLADSLHSFKVLTECPIIVVLIFQSHRNVVNENIQSFLPLIIRTLSLQPQPQAEAHEAAKARGEIFVGVAPGIRDKVKYTEFIVAQVKTLAFLAYVLRAYTTALSRYQDQVPEFIIRLLHDCPTEASATRKELLVATRHILSTEFRNGFINKLDILLNEKVLIGTGVTVFDTLKPLAYSMLADLLHHIRDKLTLQQLSKIVYIYSCILHDPTFTPNIQTMCAKLLIHLIESILNNSHRDEHFDVRDILIKTLDTFANKFENLNILFPTILPQPIHSNMTSEIQIDLLNDGRVLFRTLVAGIKPLIHWLKQCNNSITMQKINSLTLGVTQEQVEIFIQLFREGIRCFDYFNVDNLDNMSQAKLSEKLLTIESANRITKLEKEALDHFGLAFVIVDPIIFQEIFSSQMDFFFEQMLQNHSLLQISHCFLTTNDIISLSFSGILLRFLVDRLDKLGGTDTIYSSVMLRLFKSIFQPLTQFPNHNEAVLQPHVANIITSSMKFSAKAKEPINYFILLKTLFRCLAAGKYEILYREISPLLPMLLEGLNKFLTLTQKQQMQNLFVELCLTVPVRLSSLLPYLNYLMKPLVLALKAGPDLVSQGLRTLELCIDNLTPDFLDPILAPVINELMHALWRHLKPPPYDQKYSYSAMQILGKLGGRNRRMLKDPPKLNTNYSLLSTLDLQIFFNSSSASYSIQLDEYLKLAGNILQDPNASNFYKIHAYKFIVSLIPLFFDLDEGSEDIGKLIRARLHKVIFPTINIESKNNKSLSDEKMDLDIETPNDIQILPSQQLIKSKTNKDGEKNISKKKAVQEETLKNVLCALFFASSLSELKEYSWPFLQNICRHFAFLEIGELIEFNKAKKERFNFNVDDKRYSFETKAMLEALIETITSENLKLRSLASSAITIIYEACLLISGSKQIISHCPFFFFLASRFCSCCYQQEWFYKSGGCLGISIISSQLNMGIKWMLDHEIEFVKALLFVLKDISPEFAAGNIEDVPQILLRIIEICNQQNSSSIDSDVEIQDSNDKKIKFDKLIITLTSELCNVNESVRETIHSAFKLLSELTQRTITCLLSQAKDILINLMFGQPLRALPVSMQIGRIDAITYCLTLQPQFLTSQYYEDLTRILGEVVFLVDVEDDQALLSRNSLYKNPSVLNKLRIVCLKLLKAAMTLPDELFSGNNPNVTRPHIIGIFFKTLHMNVPEIIEVGTKALQQVIQQQHKLSKDLLQLGVRPILINFSDPKKLTVSALDCLARLLELLKSYFKPEIGKKLLDHLQQWADSNFLASTAGKSLTENENIKVIVAILNIFHLLPSSANSFLENLVPMVLNLEEKSCRSISSPFRLPLTKFLNRYPTESVEYFYNKIKDYQYSQLFINILGTEEALKLREEIKNNPVKLIEKVSSIQHSDASNYVDTLIRTILIIRQIIKFDPKWLSEISSTPVLIFLKEAWRDQGRINRLKNESTLNLKQMHESKYLLEIFCVYLKEKPEDIDLLFEFVSIFSNKNIIDYTFLKRFYHEEVAKKYPVTQKQAILKKFLDTFSDPNIPPNIKTLSLKIIITPMLLYDFAKHCESNNLSLSVSNTYQEHGKIIDTTQMDKIQSLWHYLADNHDEIEDSLRIEVLQFSTVIVKSVPNLITTRSPLVKFGWNWSRVDDITAKHSAFVFLAACFAEFDQVNLKMLFQSYTALLKAHQVEARVLVKQALDMLAPKFNISPQSQSFDESKKDSKKKSPPNWIVYTKRILLEDGYGLTQLINVYQLLVRHPDLFYEYREHFMPQIANTLTRLGLLQNATPETRLLTIDLAELILKWERCRLNENNMNEQNISSPASSTPTASPGKRRIELETEFSPKKRQNLEYGFSESRNLSEYNTNYIPNNYLRENVVNYLVRFVSASSDPISKNLLAHRALDLIKELLQPEFWPEVNVKLNSFERALKFNEVSNNIDCICNNLEALNVILEKKPSEYCRINLVHLQPLLERSIISNIMCIQRCLNPVLIHIYKAITPPLVEDELAQQSEQTMTATTKTNITNIVPASTSTPSAMETTTTKATSSTNTTIEIITNTSTPDAEIGSFTQLVNNTIQDAIQDPNNLYQAMMLLKAISCTIPKNIDPFLNGIINSIQTLIKRIIPQETSPTNKLITNQQSLDTYINVLIIALNLANLRITELNEMRQSFTASLLQLIENSKDIELAKTIFNMVKQWILNKELLPTMEEKTKLLVSMLCYEKLEDNSLIENVFELVIKIYSDPLFSRSELSVRLEKAFLMGTCYKHSKIRNQFMEIFDHSLSKVLPPRLHYILDKQNWELLGDYFWIHQALDLLIGAISHKKSIQMTHNLQIKSIATLGDLSSFTDSSESIDQKFEDFLQKHREFLFEVKKLCVGDLLSPLKQLHQLDNKIAYDLWVHLFPICWSAINNKERQDLTNKLVTLLSEDYHDVQKDFQPNCIQAILDGISHCSPVLKLPPHLIKYLGKLHGAWHIAMAILQNATSEKDKDDERFKELTIDALADIYSSLSEDDMFYGLWKRHCKYLETNIAISYEQNGNWLQAQIEYENALNKSNTSGSICSETEYILWEDRWILCAEKLQQWDILYDLAKDENNKDLLLNCAFHLVNWTNEKELSEQISYLSSLEISKNPQYKIFESFIALMNSNHTHNFDDYKKFIREANQLALQKWCTLPNIVSESHIPLLHSFQLMVEFDEATKIFSNLSNCNVQSPDSQNEVRNVLSSWRERLPNMWDDINIWSDVVAFRKHIFNVISKSFEQFQNIQVNSNHRGHHETAWIINRFAHVARKHQLYDVCTEFLQKIYALPNIEINEAFLKLREQTKCHYQNNEMNQALDVIVNTNLNFFSTQQKAEFHTLRGMIYLKSNRDQEANESFSISVTNDMRLAKAWAAWGYYNDRKYKEKPNEIVLAVYALTCYLQAASLYNSAKSRKLVIRILWLLSLDDAQGTISIVFETFFNKTEVPVWYWITFIPQLIICLMHKEAKHARGILMKIAKQYPQALHFQLRTAREEYLLVKKQVAIAQTQARAAQLSSTIANNPGASSTQLVTPVISSTSQIGSNIANIGNVQQPIPQNVGQSSSNQGSPPAQINILGVNTNQSNQMSSQPQSPAIQGINVLSMSTPPTLSNNITVQNMQNINYLSNGKLSANSLSNMQGTTPTVAETGRSPITQSPGMSPIHHQRTLPNIATTPQPQLIIKQPWEHVEDIMSTLKTSFPLLALTMETMVDQIQQRLKPNSDEDIYRLIVALLNDGLQQITNRLTQNHDIESITHTTEMNVKRFADNLSLGPIKTAFEEDFIKRKPNFTQYVENLRRWRDKFEVILDSKPRKQHLEYFSAYLVEFQHQKFEEVEIPGQYLLLKDNNNSDFIRIDRFMSEIEIIRSHGFCYRRLTIRGHDGSLHPFAVQYPSARHSRREERMLQLFRILNSVIEHHKESRKRNLSFHLPLIIPFAPQVRIVQDDPSYCSLQDIYEDHCDDIKISKDEPIIYFINKMKSNISHTTTRKDVINLKIEIARNIQSKYIPNDFIAKTIKSHEELWSFKKHFTSQMASVSFMTYLICVGQRHPHKFLISRNTGNIWSSELIPSFAQGAPMFQNQEPVPFRFTRSIQQFMTPIGIEGIFSSAMLAIGRCLTEPEFDLGQYLSIFIRDELITWHYISQKHPNDQLLRQKVLETVDQVVNKAKMIGNIDSNCDKNGNRSMYSSISDLIAMASNPQNLANMEVIWMQWL